MRRILLAVNDSPAGVAAARAAIGFAHECGGQVLAVHVLAHAPPAPPRLGPPASTLRADGAAGAGSGRATEAGAGRDEGTGTGGHGAERASAALLGWISELARSCDVPIETRTLPGSPAQVIIDEAAAWAPDVIVLGRSGVRHVGQPFVGSQVLHVIEFADLPVLVVPAI